MLWKITIFRLLEVYITNLVVIAESLHTEELDSVISLLYKNVGVTELGRR